VEVMMRAFEERVEVLEGNLWFEMIEKENLC